MSPLLVECGEALYGDQWVAPLARDLNIGRRTLARWKASGEMPAGAYTDLLRLTQERAAVLDGLADKLRAR